MTKGFAHISSGICPNQQCQKRLYFPDQGVSVECSGCGQRHFKSRLNSVEKQEPGLIDILEGLFFQIEKRYEKETHKVHDLSNYECAILSTFMTYYGMDKTSGKARLLTEMGKNSEFDCGQLSDRAFLIDPDHLSVTGYGRDRTGSNIYLEDTLNVIKSYNDNDERLIPIHADGDGHCLVHAISRALVGWELFWHPLRVNLKQHFVTYLEKYKRLFQDFIGDDEWPAIIDECDPGFVPSGHEQSGLRNIHIFGLANILRRPIFLLDSIAGIKSSGDYSAIFLPYFSPPSVCKNKDGMLNKPLCIAWSNQGRNHFIPLVGVRGKKCPVLSRHIIQRAWGVDDIEIDKYVDFQNGTCQIGGEKTLQIGYIQRLAKAMGEIFFAQHGIAASLVADMYLHVFKPNGLVCGVNMDMLLEKTKQSVFESQLFICLSCHHLTMSEAVDDAWFLPGGKLYKIAIFTHKTLKDGYTYTFPMHDVVATYDASLDKLVPERRIRKPSTCPYCSDGTFRQVKANYSIAYENGDRTLTRSSCNESGYKQFWSGKEYSTLPKSVKVVMEWKGKVMEESVPWFQDDEDPSNNSNVYQIVQDLVQSKFPGEFGSERLVQKVVDHILFQTIDPVRNKALPTFHFSRGEEGQDMPCSSSLSASHAEGATSSSSLDKPAPPPALTPPGGVWSPDQPSKAIITGRQSHSIHKEELTKSKTEMEIKQRINQNAAKQQSKLTDKKSKSQNKKRADDTSIPSVDKTRISKSTLPMSVSSPTISTSVIDPPANKITSPSGVGVPSSVSADNIASNSASARKRIRLCVSDGRNLTLELASQCTFSELQDLIAKHTNVLLPRQRILHGFPPMELKPPTSEQEDYTIPIQSGDKIMVDIIPDIKLEKPPDCPMPLVHGFIPYQDGQTTSSFGSGKQNEIRDTLFQELITTVHAGGNNIDDTIRLLKCTAALANKDFWAYVQRLPHLFSVNGVFYEQVARDIGLEHGKHCTISSLEQKLFVYNKHDDRLELCLEPFGHFSVESNVEIHAHTATPSSRCGLKAGQRPFTGQGHSLRSSTGAEDRMPTDIPMTPKRAEARPLNMFCDPNFHQASIEEEEEEEEDTQQEEEVAGRGVHGGFTHHLRPHQLIRNVNTPVAGAAGSGKLIRKGPGYSELSPIPEGLSGERSESLHELVSCIEQTIEGFGREADLISQTAILSSPTSKNTNTSKPVVSSKTDSHYAVDDSKSPSMFDQNSLSVNSSHNPVAPIAFPACSDRSDVVSSNGLPRKQIQEKNNSNTTAAAATISLPSVSSHRTDIQQMGRTTEVGMPNAVAAYAEKVASDLAAMDDDLEEVDCVKMTEELDEEEHTAYTDEDMRDEERDNKPTCDDESSAMVHKFCSEMSETPTEPNKEALAKHD